MRLSEAPQEKPPAPYANAIPPSRDKLKGHTGDP